MGLLPLDAKARRWYLRTSQHESAMVMATVLMKAEGAAFSDGTKRVTLRQIEAAWDEFQREERALVASWGMGE